MALRRREEAHHQSTNRRSLFEHSHDVAQATKCGGDSWRASWDMYNLICWYMTWPWKWVHQAHVRGLAGACNTGFDTAEG